MANDADITLPSLVISSATIGNSGDMTLPLFTIEAHAVTGWYAIIELPALVIEARSGAVASVELPALSVEATALMGVVCTADIILPDLIISAYTSSPIIVTANLTLQRLQISATSIHDILAAGDMELRLFFVAGTTSLAAGVITGYAINLKTLGLSEYEDFNFNSACLIGGIPFGASGLGLFRLDADNDSGTLIVSSISFPLTDFGVDNKKRIRSAFYGGKADGRMKLFIENDEENERERLFIPGSVRSKTKIPIGREGKGSYWKVRLTNVGGCNFKLDTLEVFPVLLGRV